MKFPSLNILKLLKKRPDKLTTILNAKADKENLAKLDWQEAAPAASYTMVDPSMARKLEMRLHMGTKAFEHSKEKPGKSRWMVNNTEQHYKPATSKLDPQLEFMWEELGLSQQIEQTTL